MRRACAFQFPAVLHTLGAARWADLRESYLALTRDEEVSVRRTLAFSLHAIAQVLGPQIVEAELLSVFEAFVGDAEDEVKMGVVTKLADFLAHIGATCRESYLPVLSEVISPERSSPMNWRLREAVATQIARLTTLFNAESARDVLVPLTCKLMEDDVAQIRATSLRAIAPLVQRVAEGSPDWVADFRAKLVAFVSSATFRHRQTFVFACGIVAGATEGPSPVLETLLLEHLVPQLPRLAQDPVLDVRISLARALQQFPAMVLTSEPVTFVLHTLAADSSAAVTEALPEFDRTVPLPSPPPSAPTTDAPTTDAPTEDPSDA